MVRQAPQRQVHVCAQLGTRCQAVLVLNAQPEHTSQLPVIMHAQTVMQDIIQLMVLHLVQVTTSHLDVSLL